MSDLRYFIKKPTGKRKSYSLVCYRLLSRTDKVYEQLSEPLAKQVTAINAQLHSNTISPLDAEALLKELIATQYRKLDVRTKALKHSHISDINQKVFNAFWRDVYGTRYLEDEKSPRYGILKALRLIEPLSIQAASALELQNALKRNAASIAENRKAADWLNMLLKYLGRDITLQKPKPPHRIVPHYTLEQFQTLLKYLPPHSADLAMVLFGTGVRFSEAMALLPTDLSGRELLVSKQRTFQKKLKGPKRASQGTVAVLEFALPALQRWVCYDAKETLRWKFAKDLATAAVSAELPVRCPHDLRHSHAIYLLSLGATLKQVALNLRNRQDVCEKYYIGYAHSEGTLDALKRLTSA